MSDAQDDHGLPTNLEKDTMDPPASAVEELAQSLVPLGFGRFGAAFGMLRERADRLKERVPPAIRRGLGARGKPVVLFFDLAGGLAGEGDGKTHALLAFFFCPRD